MRKQASSVAWFHLPERFTSYHGATNIAQTQNQLACLDGKIQVVAAPVLLPVPAFAEDLCDISMLHYGTVKSMWVVSKIRYFLHSEYI